MQNRKRDTDVQNRILDSVGEGEGGMLEKTLESPLGCKKIQPVHPKGDQSWVFIGRNDVEVETPILWPPDVRSWLIGKDPDARKDWGQEEKGTTEGEMVGWHHWLNGRVFGWTLGVGNGQGDLACCGSWGRKESDMTEWLNWTELNAIESSHFLLYPFPPALSHSQIQGLFQPFDSLDQVTHILELQLQHQPFQWIFRTDFF